jgi:hypothetical protein
MMEKVYCFGKYCNCLVQTGVETNLKDTAGEGLGGMKMFTYTGGRGILAT